MQHQSRNTDTIPTHFVLYETMFFSNKFDLYLVIFLQHYKNIIGVKL